MKTLDSVDPEFLKFLEDIPEEFSEITRQNLALVRTVSEELLDRSPRGGNVRSKKHTIETEVGDIDLFVYRAENDETEQPCLFWLHGGGYVVGRGEDDWFAPLFAERCNCTVVSVEYRLAPEHPYPAGIEDSFAALQWIAKNFKFLSIDPKRIAIGGASAGGGLAAGLALLNRDRNGPDIMFQLLLCPMLDNLHATKSGQIADHPVWNRTTSLNAWEMYLNGEPESDAPQYAAAARATDLSNLPPAFIPVGDVDLFRDECIEYAKNLNANDVKADVQIYPGVYHGAEISGFDTAIGKRMTNEYANALIDAFTKS